MSLKADTTIVFDETVIHTKYEGEIILENILEQMGIWGDMLFENPRLRFLIFDYTNARLSRLTPDNVREIAANTPELFRKQPELIMIGVMPEDLEFGWAKMWEGIIDIDSSQTKIFRDLDSAMDHIKNLKS